MILMSKENLHFDHQRKQVVFFLSQNFLKEIEDMLSVFLLSYKTLMDVWEISSQEGCGNTRVSKLSTTFLFLPSFNLCFNNSIETHYMFWKMKNDSFRDDEQASNHNKCQECYKYMIIVIQSEHLKPYKVLTSRHLAAFHTLP